MLQQANTARITQAGFAVKENAASVYAVYTVLRYAFWYFATPCSYRSSP